uniref:Uncharacterized protein n=1 Tax=Plectus sambesii TaxID=2011161 RepID=A0A914V0T6_9BILA
MCEKFLLMSVAECFMDDLYRHYWTLSNVAIHACSLIMAIFVVIKIRTMRIVHPSDVFASDADFEMGHFRHMNRIAIALIFCAGISIIPSICFLRLRKLFDTGSFEKILSPLDAVTYGLLLCGLINALIIGLKHQSVRSAINQMTMRTRTISRTGSETGLRLPTITVSMLGVDDEPAVRLPSVGSPQGASFFNRNEQLPILHPYTGTVLQSSRYLGVHQTVERFGREPSPFISLVQERMI